MNQWEDEQIGGKNLQIDLGLKFRFIIYYFDNFGLIIELFNCQCFILQGLGRIKEKKNVQIFGIVSSNCYDDYSLVFFTLYFFYYYLLFYTL